MHTKRLRIAGALLSVALMGVACGDSTKDTSSTSTTAAGTAAAAGQAGSPAARATSPTTATSTLTSTTKAADLRAGLNTLLQEHVYLAGAATGSALGGRDAEFKAAADALDQNSIGLSKAIGSVYGPDAEKTFLELWRKHIGFFVDYTMGVATNDQAKKDKAVADLDGYRRDFDAFISGANPNIPKGAVAELLKPHIAQLAGAVDAQGAKEYPKAYTTLRQAAAHMHMIGDPLAEATVKQFPDKFTG